MSQYPDKQSRLFEELIRQQLLRIDYEKLSRWQAFQLWWGYKHWKLMDHLFSRAKGLLTRFMVWLRKCRNDSRI